MKSTKVLILAVFVLILACINPSTASVPGANFTANVTSGTAPLTVSFTDLSSNTPSGWAWYFGDENYLEPWMEMNASPGWSARYMHSSVVMADGSIVLMGGYDTSSESRNDTLRSTDYGATWTLVNTSSGWSARYGHSSVVIADGSIVLMGGCYNDGPCRNDSWRSIDNGATWTLMNTSSGWSARGVHSSVAMQDNSIVLMGGFDGKPFLKNDVWRSTDYGATWTLVNASPGWSARRGQSSAVMPDGSIVLTGGESEPPSSLMNDTWRSIDYGTTWTRVNSSAGWTGRDYHTSVVMPDGSIVLMGGWDSSYNPTNDTWRSTDYGATWTLVNASPGWAARWGQSSAVMPDGSIVLTGGGYTNDTWRLMPAGSSEQNPLHAYTRPGVYSVTLQSYNAEGYNNTRRTGYITVSGVNPTIPSQIGVFRPATGTWYLDTTSTGVVNKSFQFGKYGDDSVTGDWNGEEISNTGIFRPATGIWYLDTTKTGVVTKSFQFGKLDDTPIIGDWDGDGISDAGIFRPSNGNWYLDTTKTGVVNKSFQFGKSGDIPVVGDWDGNGISDIGVFRESAGIWYLDYNNTGHVDNAFFFGKAGDIPVVGDWDGDGTSDIGIFRPSNGNWYLNYYKNGPIAMVFHFGKTGDIPVVGDWDGDGISDVGVFRSATGTWYLDTTKTGVISSAFQFGKSGDIPVVGKWI